MEKVTNAVILILVSFIISVIIGYFLIKILTKNHINQSLSIYLEDRHSSKSHTPTFGGLIFLFVLVIVGLILYITNKITISFNLIIVWFTFFSYSLIGFIDDYLIIKRKNNIGLTEIQKLSLQAIVALIFFYVYMHSGAEAVLEIHTLGITINMGWFYGIFILFMLVASSNAVNITDGLDGLAGGLAVIAYLAFALISWNSFAITGTEDIAIFIFVLVGSLIGFLVFNTYPAKVFMGDTGSLALGATLAAIAIITKHEITFIVVMLVFIFETVVCLIQIVSMVFFHKKIFLMTPYHHHMEKLGWKETDIVKAFWIVGLVLSMSAIIFGVWL